MIRLVMNGMEKGTPEKGGESVRGRFSSASTCGMDTYISGSSLCGTTNDFVRVINAQKGVPKTRDDSSVCDTYFGVVIACLRYDLDVRSGRRQTTTKIGALFERTRK